VGGGSRTGWQQRSELWHWGSARSSRQIKSITTKLQHAAATNIRGGRKGEAARGRWILWTTRPRRHDVLDVLIVEAFCMARTMISSTWRRGDRWTPRPGREEGTSGRRMDERSTPESIIFPNHGRLLFSTAVTSIFMSLNGDASIPGRHRSLGPQSSISIVFNPSVPP
jgi:hypothetical protein